jgi:hypothetical protein
VTGPQLIRIGRLRRFVGIFARGGDRETTVEALRELARASRATGLSGEALLRARQAAELLSPDADPVVRGEAVLALGVACLDTDDAPAALAAAELVAELATSAPESAAAHLRAGAALLAGTALVLEGDDASAREQLNDARERLAATGEPEGAALALAQLAQLDLAAGRRAAAKVCYRFACDFYRLAGRRDGLAELSALAARELSANAADADADAWYVDAITAADAAGMVRLGAELSVERAVHLADEGNVAAARQAAIDGIRRAGLVEGPMPELAVAARLVLARFADSNEVFRHLEAAFDLALDLRDGEALGRVMDIVVSGLVGDRFVGTDRAIGWRLVDRFRERLEDVGLQPLADAAAAALLEFREDVVSRGT